MLRTATLLLLVCSASGQAPGDGISKQTYAVTDPQASYTFFSKYLPIHCADSAAMCNSSSPTCGQKGRSNLCDESTSDCSGGTFDSFMFHMVNTSARPSGPTTVAQVEAIFDEKLNAAFTAKRYDAFMDYSVAFWASDLDLYLTKFDADAIPFLALEWKDDTSTPYYSVLFHAPHTQVIVELISSVKPKNTAATWVADETLRYTSGIFVEMGATSTVNAKILRPLAVSKATSDMDALIDWYENALFAKLEYNISYSDGTRYAYFNPGFTSMSAKMQVRFVYRPSNATTKSLSVAGLEKIKFAGHDQVHDNKGNLSANCICGFDKWYDNHYGIDTGYTTLTQYKAAFDKRNWPYYHAWGGAPGPENVYVVDPTGDSIQLDNSWTNGAPAGVADDALGTMCSQGNCKLQYPPTPAECATALTLYCPGLGLKDAPCSDCVYDNAHWPKLKKAGCFNADAVAYCTGT